MSDDVGDPPLSPTLKRKRGDSATSNDGLAHLLHNEEQCSPAFSSESEVEEVDLDEVDLEEVVESFAAGKDSEALQCMGTPAEVRAKVKDVGISQFVEDLLESTGKTAEEIGATFGLLPEQVPDPEVYMFLLERILLQALTRRRKLPQFNTVDDAAGLLRKSKNILVITGAGISTSLGIPDFRSKHTGFYSKLQEMGFSEPEEVFDIHIFDDNPSIFYSLAGDILPEGKRFTPTHGFIRLLQDQDKLQTNYTQNIDNLEANAGLNPDKVIQCHGSFATASCRKCKHQVPGEDIFDALRAKQVSYCSQCTLSIQAEASRPEAKRVRRRTNNDDDDDDDEDEDDDIPTAGVMKPDITFFGEQLPDTFFDRFLKHDSHAADLVIVIGTSLKVAPVADMPNHLPEHIPHIYISREPCQHINFDIQLLGDCDAVCWELSRRAGWDLTHEMIPQGFATAVDAFEDNTHIWNISTATKPDK